MNWEQLTGIGRGIAEFAKLIGPGVVVAITGYFFTRRVHREMEHVKSKLHVESELQTRKLDALEHLWELVTDCHRAMLSYRTAKEHGGNGLDWHVNRIQESRNTLKNFVFGRGLYFDAEITREIQELDVLLRDKRCTAVGYQVSQLKSLIRVATNEPVKHVQPARR